MPVEGIPDREKHGFCLVCHQWHDRSEGQMLPPPASRPLSGMFSAAKQISGLEEDSYFICDGCLRRRRLRQAILWGLFAIVVATVLILSWLKAI